VLRKEFRAPKAYESLRGTNPRARDWGYGDLIFSVERLALIAPQILVSGLGFSPVVPET
jgi:hypothetical protein